QKKKGFGPTRKSKTGRSAEQQLGDFLKPKPFQVEVKKVPAEAKTPDGVIRQRKPAPFTQPEEDGDKSPPGEKSDSETEESQARPLNLDHKFVGSSRPKRTRLVIRSRFENAVIVRSKVGPVRDWTLTLQGTKLANN
ncbi:MAG: hypothetical protein IH899_07290, partial [Planctomycetes bacterium]|nr:hypothetical protein [Planctomycetota bacterium]